MVVHVGADHHHDRAGDRAGHRAGALYHAGCWSERSRADRGTAQARGAQKAVQAMNVGQASEPKVHLMSNGGDLREVAPRVPLEQRNIRERSDTFCPCAGSARTSRKSRFPFRVLEEVEPPGVNGDVKAVAFTCTRAALEAGYERHTAAHPLVDGPQRLVPPSPRVLPRSRRPRRRRGSGRTPPRPCPPGCPP